jgi:hypothetical protein
MTCPGCFHLHSEDGGGKVLRNVGILPQDYTVSQEELDLNLHRRENLKSSCLCNALNGQLQAADKGLSSRSEVE